MKTKLPDIEIELTNFLKLMEETRAAKNALVKKVKLIAAEREKMERARKNLHSKFK